eukprot:3370326-Amphidinium_carterae.2
MTARAQSSGSDTDKSKKNAKYTDAKKSVRPQKSLEQVKIFQIEWRGNWWIWVQHDVPKKSTFDIKAIQNQYIIKEDADVWVEEVINISKIPIIAGGDPYAMVDSKASHMLLPLKFPSQPDKKNTKKIQEEH